MNLVNSMLNQGRIMKRSFLILLTLLIAFPTMASSKLSYVNVENGVLYFSTHGQKSEQSPECLLPSSKAQWAVSLDTTEGRHIKAILLTAVAGGLSVEVQTAGDCRAALGYERAISVALVN
jgi:hypothetical protein